jgi:sugar lactone lactonase YvrE
VLFDAAKHTLIAFPGGYPATSYVVPNSVTSIGYSAFAGCSGLISVTIKDGVTIIGDSAFFGCSGLELARFLGNAPTTFGSGVFDQTASGFKVLYQYTAKGFSSPTWNGYPAQVEFPANLANDVTTNRFTAGWLAVAGASSYHLTVYSDAGLTTPVTGYQDLNVGNVTSEAVTGLNPGATYYYSVKAYNGSDVIGDSSTISVTISNPISIARPLTIATLAGKVLTPGSADGTGTSAGFDSPMATSLTHDGNTLYVADTDNNSIRAVQTSNGVVTTLTGANTLNSPAGVVTDSSGNLYVADTLNHAIRKVTSSGVVSILAGNAGTSGSADGTGTAALFNAPQGITINPSGNLYVADTGNEAIRMVTVSGAVTTIAGNAGTSGHTDGAGTAATFNGPTALAADSSGNLYVADTDNHTIRKVVASTGVVTTLAGIAASSGCADGTSSTAQFNSPSGIAVDPQSGNLYVADTDNFTIRMVVPSTGVVSTLAGTVGTSGSTDGSGSNALFYSPSGIACDSNGYLYIADTNNQTIRSGYMAAAPVITSQPQSATVTAGSSATFSISATGRPAPTYQWYFGGTAISGATSNSYTVDAAQAANAGSYYVVATNASGTVTSTTVILTVNTQPTTTIPPTNGGGGGGGAVSPWVLLSLGALALIRFFSRRH